MIQKQDLCDTGMCRPGGFDITNRAMDFCAFNARAKVIDVGCGLGASVRHVRGKFDLDMRGVDLHTNAANCVKGDAHSLPFEDSYADGVLFECSFNKMQYPTVVLAEVFRVLKPLGKLIIADFYHGEMQDPNKTESTFSVSPVGTRDSFTKYLDANGFSLLLFEDFTKAMKQLWGQMIFTYGAKLVRKRFGCGEKGSAASLCYGLFIAQKKGE